MRRKPTPNEWLVVGGATLWLVAFFLPWYHATAPGLSQSIPGNVAGGMRWFLFVVAFLVLAFAVVVSFEFVEVDLPVSNGLLLLLAGTFLAVTTLVYAVWTPTGWSFSYGVWLSLLGALCITYGGFASHSSEAVHTATSRPDMRWTPQPPQRGSASGQDAGAPAQGPLTRPRQRGSGPKPAVPPTQSIPQSQTGTPQEPIPPGYPHGQGHGYGGGQGEGW